MDISDHNIILTSTDEMRQICCPLFQNTPIHYFEYVRVYDNGRAIKLDTEQQVLPHILSNDLYLRPSDIVEFKNYLLMSSSLPRGKDNIAVEVLRQYRDYFNLDHFFFSVKTRVNYFEVFVFGTDRNNDPIIDYYFNQLELLENFQLYFADKARDLIREALREAIYFKEWASDQPSMATSSCGLADQTLPFQPNFVYLWDQRGKTEITLRYLEFQCLNGYLKGLSSKESAAILNVSHRTVEKYIAAVKAKLKCHSKQQLSKLLYVNGYH